MLEEPKAAARERPAGERGLAAYATPAHLSGGRLYSEPPCPMRSDFQRDRDRIVHAT